MGWGSGFLDLWGSGISGEAGQDWICLLAEELGRRDSATFLTSLTERATPRLRKRLRGSCVGCFSGVLELSWSGELKCFEWGFLDFDFDEDESSIGITARERDL